MSPAWLRDAVFYEIYPQSFYDSNGDGIGDLNGIRKKLDYIRSLGCSAVWLNPCFDSPFKDAGYDVRDYRRVAPRYGTNEDLCALFAEAHARDMHVLLDLVPGHTSEEHAWFKESGSAQKNSLSGRYIWTDGWFADSAGLPCIRGECPRDGGYIVNFFKCQPALNYGFLHPEAPWQQAPDAPDALSTREAVKDIMRFWLSRGCDGFRKKPPLRLFSQKRPQRLLNLLKQYKRLRPHHQPSAIRLCLINPVDSMSAPQHPGLPFS